MNKIIKRVHLGNYLNKGVSIIGAGPSGILASKHMKDWNFDVRCFEAKGSVGGIWNTKDILDERKKEYNNFYGMDPAVVYEGLTMNVPQFCF